MQRCGPRERRAASGRPGGRSPGCSAQCQCLAVQVTCAILQGRVGARCLQHCQAAQCQALLATARRRCAPAGSCYSWRHSCSAAAGCRPGYQVSTLALIQSKRSRACSALLNCALYSLAGSVGLCLPALAVSPVVRAPAGRCFPAAYRNSPQTDRQRDQRYCLGSGGYQDGVCLMLCFTG